MTDTHRDSEGRDVVTALSTAAQQLTGQQQGSETETLKLIVDGAVETIPGAEHAGVSLVHANGEITSAALSSDAVRAVDQLQVTYREGPCVTALSDKHTVLVDDLEAESWRWPQFAPQAVASGVASMLSFQLFARAARRARSVSPKRCADSRRAKRACTSSPSTWRPMPCTSRSCVAT